VEIVVLFNPRSGGTQRDAEVDRLTRALGADGHAVRVVRAGAPDGPPLLDVLKGAGALVVVGGDGTVHYALGAAARAGVPLYHWPTGTENLLAREFGMERSEAALRRAIAGGRVLGVDCGDADGRLFALMCSVGPDAAVVHSLTGVRRGTITRWAYVPHVWKVLRRPPAVLRVWVDGELVVDGVPGMCVVANSRQYGAGMGPAKRASMTDGLLDTVFLPAASTMGSLWWMLRARLGLHERDPRLVYRTGREVVVANAGAAPACVQCDGEATGELSPGGGPDGAVQVVVRERALRVLGGT